MTSTTACFDDFDKVAQHTHDFLYGKGEVQAKTVLEKKLPCLGVNNSSVKQDSGSWGGGNTTAFSDVSFGAGLPDLLPPAEEVLNSYFASTINADKDNIFNTDGYTNPNVFYDPKTSRGTYIHCNTAAPLDIKTLWDNDTPINNTTPPDSAALTDSDDNGTADSRTSSDSIVYADSNSAASTVSPAKPSAKLHATPPAKPQATSSAKPQATPSAKPHVNSHVESHVNPHANSHANSYASSQPNSRSNPYANPTNLAYAIPYAIPYFNPSTSTQHYSPHQQGMSPAFYAKYYPQHSSRITPVAQQGARDYIRNLMQPAPGPFNPQTTAAAGPAPSKHKYYRDRPSPPSLDQFTFPAPKSDYTPPVSNVPGTSNSSSASSASSDSCYRTSPTSQISRNGSLASLGTLSRSTSIASVDCAFPVSSSFVINSSISRENSLASVNSQSTNSLSRSDSVSSVSFQPPTFDSHPQLQFPLAPLPQFSYSTRTHTPTPAIPSQHQGKHKRRYSKVEQAEADLVNGVAVYRCQWGGGNCSSVLPSSNKGWKNHLKSAHHGDLTPGPFGKSGTRNIPGGTCRWRGCETKNGMAVQSIARHICSAHAPARHLCRFCSESYSRIDSVRKHERVCEVDPNSVPVKKKVRM